ncbi:hypothetical protein PRZ48_008915 [Zasmidium cellare]|uniref:Uncharacterized protein n=1 Tax=Zasmidium cellare TaxID=395010 RepID=A0ABR0EHH9_ZASCE|nr:hypothetical protein PRZ48_008915 [Zasmidium cellare]
MRLSILSLLSAFSAARFQEQTVFAPGQALAHVYNRGAQTDILHIYDMAVDPNPVEKDFPRSLNNLFRLMRAYVDMTISIGLLRQPTQRIDLCDKANGYVKLDCPIEKGLVDGRRSPSFC